MGVKEHPRGHSFVARGRGPLVSHALPTLTPFDSGAHHRRSSTATLVLALMDEVLGPWRRKLTDRRLDAVSPLPPAESRLMTPYGRRASTGSTLPARFHIGIDLWAPRGTPVFSVLPGVVERVLTDDCPVDGFVGYGNGVVVRHPVSDCWTFYAHLDEVLVLEGMSVERGQAIGRVGNTTNERLLDLVVRLHFEVRIRRSDGRSPFPGPRRVNNLDPAAWLARHGVGIDRQGRFVAPASQLDADQERWLEQDVEYVQSADSDEVVLIEGGFDVPTPIPRLADQWDEPEEDGR